MAQFVFLVMPAIRVWFSSRSLTEFTLSMTEGFEMAIQVPAVIPSPSGDSG